MSLRESLRENEDALRTIHLNRVYASSPLSHLREAEDAICDNIAHSFQWAQKIMEWRKGAGLRCFPVRLDPMFAPMFARGEDHVTVRERQYFPAAFELVQGRSLTGEVLLVFKSGG